MEEQAEPTEEGKQSGGLAVYACAAAVVLLLYVLSAGPYVMMLQKRYAASSRRGGDNVLYRLYPLYYPLFWACSNTPLHKPLGLYFHLWCPRWFDKKGEPIH